MAAPVERVPSDDWGWHASPDESDDDSPQMSSSSSDDQGNSSDTAATRGTSTSSSTAGLAELNSWLYDSCEMGVAAWMRAGASETQGRRRCYFTTGDDVRVGPPSSERKPRRQASPAPAPAPSSSSDDDVGYRPRPARTRDASQDEDRPGRITCRSSSGA